jgi:hypothetical protein
MDQGSPVSIKMVFYENTGGEMYVLSWSSPSQAKQVLPVLS